MSVGNDDSGPITMDALEAWLFRNGFNYSMPATMDTSVIIHIDISKDIK